MLKTIERNEYTVNRIIESSHVSLCDNQSIEFITKVLLAGEKASKGFSYVIDINEHKDLFNIKYADHIYIAVDYDTSDNIAVFDGNSTIYDENGKMTDAIIVFSAKSRRELDREVIAEFLVHEFNHCKECAEFHQYIVNKIKEIYKENPDAEIDPKYILNPEEDGIENFYIKKYYNNYKVDLAQINHDMQFNTNDYVILLYWLFVDTEYNALASQLYGDLFRNFQNTYMINRNAQQQLYNTNTYRIYNILKDRLNKYKQNQNEDINIVKQYFVKDKTLLLTDKQFNNMFIKTCEHKLKTLYQNFGMTLSYFLSQINPRKDYLSLSKEKRRELYDKELRQFQHNVYMNTGVPMDLDQYDKDFKVTYTAYNFDHETIYDGAKYVLTKIKEQPSYKFTVYWNKVYECLDKILDKYISIQ